MEGNLVIVESPTKARTIQRFLGSGFTVKASEGHIRDLQEKQLSIDIKGGFTPEYVIPDNKKRVVAELNKLAREADVVWLASDEDREGEAISWHLMETLGLDRSRTRRIAFHEITKDAILRAIDNPRDVDMNLVNAQQARRVLDRLVGFELSPILWKKINRGLSAGRVQSVALRLVVDREREIMAFRPEPYYRVEGQFTSPSGAQLKGMFVGQTAPKVHQIFEDHDIIIIDEAYSLTASDNGGMDTYSQEALAQLAIELEDHGKDRLIFFAGYGGSDVTEKNNKMKDFLDSNPGIKSRINGTIVFPSYNALQMIDIVKGIAGRYGFVFEEDAMAPVYTYFEKRVGDNNFGNGREARSFVDNCQMTMAERIMEIPAAKQTKRMMQVITKKDVIDTVKKLSEADDSQYGRGVRYGFA